MVARPGHKQTEVGVIPQDWEVARLGAVCSMKSGESITSASIDEFSEYPCYGGNGLRGFTGRFTHDGRYALVGRQGALCGNVLSVEGRLFASEHAIVVTALSRTDIRWLTFMLGAMRLNQYSESSAQPGLSVSKLLNLDVACPPTQAEQETIGQALCDMDALIGSLERLLSKSQEIKQGVMQELLTGRKRLPGFSGNWEEKRLDELGQWTGGMTPSMRNSEYWEPGTVPWISSGDVKRVRLVTTAFWISEHAVRQGATTLLPPQSIVVVTRSGILRKFLPVAMNMIPMAINQDIKALLPNEHGLPEYLLHSLTFNGDRILARCLKSGTTVESIEFSWLKALTIPMPPIHEQNVIAGVLSDMDAEIASLDDRLTKARQLKQGMMQELLTGRIRLV